MTKGVVKEYAAAIRDRYHRACRLEKKKILDEFVKVTGYHRKAAIRLLLKTPQQKEKPPGRPASYKEVQEPLKAIWEAADRLCSKRLAPFIPEMIQVLKQKGELSIDADIEVQLRKLSPATIDRLLEPVRRIGGRKPLSTTRPGSKLKNSIPIRTFADWQENQPGFLEIDTVAHCGERAEGFYLNTPCGVDVASGWTECIPVFGKWQVRVRQAVHRIRQNLPFPLLGVDSDNGSEFTAETVQVWLAEKNVGPAFIPPGQPWKNGFIESFHDKFRDECLQREWFQSLLEAQVVIEAWRVMYNTHRPHSSLAYQTPAAFVAQHVIQPDQTLISVGHKN